jgi:hypothetical protein
VEDHVKDDVSKIKTVEIGKRKELKELEEILEVVDEKSLVDNANLKIRIATICLELMDETPNDAASIMKTSSIITHNFVWYTYGDRLDEVMDLAGELELSEGTVAGNIQEKWSKARQILKEYLGLS